MKLRGYKYDFIFEDNTRDVRLKSNTRSVQLKSGCGFNPVSIWFQYGFNLILFLKTTNITSWHLVECIENSTTW